MLRHVFSTSNGEFINCGEKRGCESMYAHRQSDKMDSNFRLWSADADQEGPQSAAIEIAA